MAMKKLEHHTFTVCAAKDGTLGYSDRAKYVPIYGRLQQVSDVTPVKVTTSRHIHNYAGINVGTEGASLDLMSQQKSTREETFFMENVLFKYEGDAFGSEVVYVQEEWQKGYAVRRLFANALCGTGAMLTSNKDRVYVLDSSIPHENEMVGRGYLKVDGSDKVEHFLRGMRWASRCEGILSRPTERGEEVNTFVIKDRTLEPATVGYYVVCTKSHVPDQLICHLEPIGWFLDYMRSLVWHTGDSELGAWALRVHGAKSFLFD